MAPFLESKTFGLCPELHLWLQGVQAASKKPLTGRISLEYQAAENLFFFSFS
jgi:hypothetical protein